MLHIMKFKILLFLLLLITTNLFGNNRVLIITNNAENYNKISNEIVVNSDKIEYEIELKLVEDDPINMQFQGSENYLRENWHKPPLFTYYLSDKSKSPIMVYGFNSKSQPRLNVVKILLKKLFLENRIAVEFPLYITNIIPEKKVVKLYRDSGYDIILLEGAINTLSIIETLYTRINVDDNEHHYFIIPFFGKTIYLTEKSILITNGIFLFFIILLLNIYSKRLSFHIRFNKKYILSIPVKILLLFIFYFISTLILKYVENLPGGDGIILNYPKTFFILKNLILFFIYGICFQIIKDVSISKSPYFYGIFSLFGSLLIYSLLVLIYLPLGLYQFWPILFSILYLITDDKYIKRFFLILTPIFIGLIFYTFLNTDYINFSNLMLISKYKGNVLLTIIATPYIFLHESFYRFYHRKQNKIIISKDIVQSLLTITITITIIAILLEINMP